MFLGRFQAFAGLAFSGDGASAFKPRVAELLGMTLWANLVRINTLGPLHQTRTPKPLNPYKPSLNPNKLRTLETLQALHKP